jgi:hypothetical protein
MLMRRSGAWDDMLRYQFRIPYRLVMATLASFAALSLLGSPAHAEPIPAITPFEGLWVPRGERAMCKDARHSGGGDHLLIEGRAIGAGDTACTLQDMTVQGAIHYFRTHCHGLNRSFAGTRQIRIDVLSADRILFRHQGEAPGEMERCR